MNRQHRLDRRRFLGFSLGAIAGSGLIGSTLFQGSPLLGKSRRLARPREVQSGGLQLPEFCWVAIAELSMTEFIDDCARFGCDGTELTSYYMPADADDAYFHGLRRHAFRLGLDVSGTAVGNDFGFPSGDARRADRVGQDLGGSSRDDGGSGHSNLRWAPQTGDDRRGEPSADGRGDARVLRLRRHAAGFTSRSKTMAVRQRLPGGLLPLANDVDSPWFGVNLDTGNFHGESIYDELAEVAHLAINVQVKVAVTWRSGQSSLPTWGESRASWLIPATVVTSCWNTRRTRTRARRALGTSMSYEPRSPSRIRATRSRVIRSSKSILGRAGPSDRIPAIHPWRISRNRHYGLSTSMNPRPTTARVFSWANRERDN
ncbi:MAG: hypothetical protein R3B96_23455 [Pirellulaceae bacterium]